MLLVVHFVPCCPSQSSWEEAVGPWPWSFFFFFFFMRWGFKDKNGAVGSTPSGAEVFLAPPNHPAQTRELPLMGGASYQD